ncbi:MAG: hypothetical protein ABFD64_13970 [Armatimonadota bacterium]
MSGMRMPAWWLRVIVSGIILLGGLNVVWAEEGEQHDFVESPVPLGYPDEQIILPLKGKITYTIKVSGQTVRDGGDATVTTVANMQATTTFAGGKTSVERKSSYNGTLTFTAVYHETGEKSTGVETISFNDTTSLPISEDDLQGIVGRVAVSKKLGRACFQLMENNWSVTDDDAPTVVHGAAGSATTHAGSSITVRIPYYAASPGTAFANFANKAEATGIGVNNTPFAFTEGGVFEVPWSNGGSKGSMSVPVVAVVGPGCVMADSMQSFKAQWGDALKEIPLMQGTLTVDWSVGDVPVEPKMIIYPVEKAVYQKWVPVPRMQDNPSNIYGLPHPLLIMAELKPQEKGKPAPKGRIDFYLTGVSENKGRCCNYPFDVSKKTDLCFADDQGEGIVIDPNDPKHAYTSERVSQAVVIVESKDCGAYGKLKAVCDELNQTAQEETSGKQFLAIPRDENENHVSDAWEEENGIPNYDKDWDEEEVAGQDIKGDGLSLYREYRGFVVLDGSTLAYKRLSPKEKDLFVIDESNVFNQQLWKQASGITAYRLNNQLVFNRGGLTIDRIVDYKMGEIKDYHKFAVRLVVPPGLEDPDKLRNGYGTYGYCSNGDCPEDADYTKIFPARLRRYIGHIYTFLDHALNRPGSDEDKQLQASGIPHSLAMKAFKQMGEDTREKLVQQMVTVCAIHEVGHACGLPGHEVTNSDGSSSESSEGNPICPMRYPDESNELDLGILQVLFKIDAPLPLQYDHFCTGGQYNCRKKLNVKDKS